MTGCKPCAPGYWCAEGAAAALPCAAGTYSTSTSLRSVDECTPCTLGHFCGVATVMPQPCTPGSYAPHTGMET